MAGHSKWKNIQHRKGAQDAKRGKIFTKIGIEITVAARMGGPDPDDNPRLRAALTKARAANMPKDNYMRAIKKGAGESDGSNYTEKTYEGYGPAGVALIVECLTDNVNRTVAEIRHAFSRHGGNLGTDGSVAWMFKRQGVIAYPREAIESYDTLFEVALENGAEDVKDEDGQVVISCAPDDFMQLKTVLDEINSEPCFCEITQIAENSVPVDDEGKVETLNRLVSLLEDSDDVQNVYHNADID